MTSVSTGSDAATAAPTVYVARQPVMDASNRVYGYELLFRAGLDSVFALDDSDQASRQTINNAINLVGVQDLVGSAKMLINFPRELLLEQQYMVLPKGQTIVELLENVDPDEDVIDACRMLKECGYMLALDDFVFKPAYQPLLDLADLVKVDFMISDHDERARLVQEFGRPGLHFLAEKVETHEEVEQAKALGYSHFQGYYFCKPQMVQGQDIPSHQQNYLTFLSEVSKPELDYDRIEDVIKHEGSLSVKLLRYLNSAAMGVRTKVTSFRQAIALLGERPLKKWAMLVSMTCLGRDKPKELVRVCLARARFCEVICEDLDMTGRELDLFLMGLLSALDALVDQPLHQLLAGLPLAPDIKSTLLGGSKALGKIQLLVLALERGDWQNVELLSSLLKIDDTRVAYVYDQALRWADKVFTI